MFNQVQLKTSFQITKTVHIFMEGNPYIISIMYGFISDFFRWGHSLRFSIYHTGAKTPYRYVIMHSFVLNYFLKLTYIYFLLNLIIKILIIFNSPSLIIFSTPTILIFLFLHIHNLLPYKISPNFSTQYFPLFYIQLFLI